MTIGEVTENYIAYRRSLGEKYYSGAKILQSFERYLGKGRDMLSINIDDCIAFLYGGKDHVTATWFNRYSTLKWMFEWALVRGFLLSVPLPSDKPQRPDTLRPYIYSKEELRRLFDAALVCQKRPNKTAPETLQLILKLTYFLGLRISETLAIRIKDLNMDESYVTIRDSKFYKSRMVPFNRSIYNLIKVYLESNHNQYQDNEELLFLPIKGMPISQANMTVYFARIRELAGVSRNDGCCFQPRIHDLRHSFAVHRLTAWYKEGKDVQKYLNYLSTFLGHDHISHTSVYLTMTDELFREANKLFESYKNNETDF